MLNLVKKKKRVEKKGTREKFRENEKEKKNIVVCMREKKMEETNWWEKIR